MRNQESVSQALDEAYDNLRGIRAIADLMILVDTDSHGEPSLMDGTFAGIACAITALTSSCIRTYEEVNGTPYGDEVRELVDKRLAHLERREKAEKRDADSTVALDSDELIENLSVAYRSNGKLRGMLASIHEAARETEYDGKVDWGWAWEAAHDVSTEGSSALIKAAKLLGSDENGLARFTPVEDQS